MAYLIFDQPLLTAFSPIGAPKASMTLEIGFAVPSLVRTRWAKVTPISSASAKGPQTAQAKKRVRSQISSYGSSPSRRRAICRAPSLYSSPGAVNAIFEPRTGDNAPASPGENDSAGDARKVVTGRSNHAPFEQQHHGQIPRSFADSSLH